MAVKALAAEGILSTKTGISEVTDQLLMAVKQRAEVAEVMMVEVGVEVENLLAQEVVWALQAR
jgi:exo-beta-1,3-glucanase (GH17 family)